ncbi:MAG: hypothetical protein Q8R76_04045 [Candidatus Omnitrophota bacterium]|nr:hypothetical protein [Candidatus Omnitrophota bacterium]
MFSRADGITLVIAVFLSIVASEGVLWIMGFQRAADMYDKKGVGTYKEVQGACRMPSFSGAIDQGFIFGNSGNLRSDERFGYTNNVESGGFNGQMAPPPITHKRVLVLGDSFTAGLSADPGKGFVELLNQEFGEKGVLFINAGVQGYGQNNQLQVLRYLFDIVKPDIVVLPLKTVPLES